MVLKEMEDNLESLYNRDGFDCVNEALKLEMNELQERKRDLLSVKEKYWRLKIRALWI